MTEHKNNDIKVKLFKAIPYILVALAIIVQLYVYTAGNSNLHAIPGCLYGCYDTAVHSHLRNLIEEPTNTWENSGFGYDGSPNIFPKANTYVQATIYHALKGFFGWDLFTSWKATLVYSALVFVVLSVASFFVFKDMFKNSYLAVLLMLLTTKIAAFPVFHHRPIVPIIILISSYLLFKFLTKKDLQLNKKNLIQATLLIIMLIFLFNYYITIVLAFGVFMFAFLLVNNFADIKNKKFRKIISKKSNIWIIAIIGLAGFLTLLTPWWYHIMVVGPRTNYATSLKLNDDPDFAKASLYFGEITNFVKIYIDFSSIQNAITTLLFWTGIIFIFTRKKQTIKHKFSLVLIAAYLIAGYHYLITIPIGMEFTPHKLAVSFSYASIIIPAAIGLLYLHDITKHKYKYANNVFLVVIFILTIFALSQNVNIAAGRYANNQYEYARTAEQSLGNNMYKSLYYDYYVENDIKPTDSIVITTNELSTVLNSVVGTGIVAGRYGFYYQYMDHQPYWFDTAVILYSNNTEARKSLLEKYSSYGKELYVYWDYYWINSEYQANPQGQIVGYYNPLKFYSPEYKDMLRSHNITFFEERQSQEPNTYYQDKYRQFDFAFVGPQNYRSSNMPWDADLTKYLEPVWKYDYQNQTIGVLYKVNLE